MAISSVKVVLLSTGVLSMAILLKLSVPVVLYFYLHQAPLIWTSVVSWLRPPYLYVVINCIIITIAASSRFHKHEDQDQDQEQGHRHRDEPQVVEIPRKVTLAEMRDVAVVEADSVCVEAILDDPEEGKLLGGGFCKDKSEEVLINGDGGDDVDDIGGEDEYVISRSTWVPPPKRVDSSEKELLEDVVSLSPASSEKPLVSSRFGHRKPGRPSPEGGRGALRVSKPKRQETLENTWKTITEGSPMPLARHLKKSETFGDHGRQVNVSPVAAVKKSETLRDRTNYQLPPVVRPSPSPPPSGKLRKESSLSQDELNRRVEAFIKKFNEEMRLQRQESLNQYKEMMMASRAD